MSGWRVYLIPVLGGLLLTVLAFDAAAGGFGSFFGGMFSSDLTITQDGKSDYVVVVSTKATKCESYAAVELVKYLELMTGAKLAVVKDDTSPQEREIVVGTTNLRLGLAGLDDPPDFWKDDECRLKTARSRLFLTGSRPRGALYAVYEFLERNGVRFFAPDVTRIPKTPTLTCPPMDVVCTPAFQGRGHMLYAVLESDNDWAARLRYNSPWFGKWQEERGGNIRHGFAPHSFLTIIPPEKYFKEHPEWFSEINGQRLGNQQLCLTNPGLREEVVKILLERMRRAPEVRHWDVSQGDNLGFCQCAACKAVADAEGSQSGPIIQFVNAIAERIEREFPRNIISTFAYHYSEDPPKNLKARSNVAVRLCTRKDIVRPLSPDSPIKTQSAMAKRFEDWRPHAENLFVWDYDTNFADYTDIFPSYAMYGQHLRFYRDHNVKIVDMQGAYSAPWGDLCFLRGYVLAKLLWDTGLDERALTREYLEGVYGSCADSVMEYLDACVAVAVRNHPDKSIPLDSTAGYGCNGCGFTYKDLQPWRDTFEGVLASETDPVRQKHLKLLLLPIYRVMVSADLPKLVECPEGLKPNREIGDDYRRTVDRLFQIGRDLGVKKYSEGGGDFETLEKEVRSCMRSQPYLHLSSEKMLVRLLPGSGGGIRFARIPADKGAIRMRLSETSIGWKWHDPGWCENYQIEESSAVKCRMRASLSGMMELERTVELTAPTTIKITEKLTNRGPEQLQKPIYTNYIFPMTDGQREAETLHYLQADGKWKEGRFPNGRYEQMQAQGYNAGGGWALVSKKTGEGVAARFDPKGVAVMGFWVDNNFSFQLITPNFRLDKEQSGESSHTLEFLSAEQAKSLTGNK